MLFNNNNFRSKFCLVGLKAAERNLIENLIKENGGEISAVNESPALPFGNEKSVRNATDLLFHVNFIHECVRQKKVLSLHDFIIRPGYHLTCLQCMFLGSRRICPKHASSTSDTLHTFTPTQMKNSFNIDQTNAHAESVEKRPCNAEQVTQMLPIKSNRFPTKRQFLPQNLLPPELPHTIDSTRNSDFHPTTSLRDSNSLPDESPLEANLDLDMECLGDDSSVHVVLVPPEAPEDDSFEKYRGFTPIRLSFVAKPVKPNSDQEMIEVPKAARFEELACEQEAEIDVASSRTEIEAEPGPSSGDPAGGVRTKDALAEMADFLVTLSDSDDTDYGLNLNRRGVLRKKTRRSGEKNIESSSPEKHVQKNHKKPKLEVIDLTTDDDEPIEISIEGEKSLRVTEQKTKKLQKQKQAADLDLTPNYESIRTSREKGKQPKTEKLKKPQPKAADHRVSVYNQLLRASRQKENQRKTEKLKNPQTKAADLDQQPSTSRMRKPKTANNGRSTAVGSTRPMHTISIEETDTSFDEEDARLNETRNRRSLQKSKKRHVVSRNFLPWEQCIMIKYLIKQKCILDAKGLQVWQKMINERKLEHRTPHSLNNHFRKILLPSIDRFVGIGEKSLAKFRKLQRQ